MQFETRHNPRLLSIDLRPQRFGYAVFEGPKRLLDWGACFYPPGGNKGARVAGRKVASLLKTFLPSVIVVKRALHKTAHNSAGVRPILNAIRREASSRSVAVCFVARTEVRKAFRIFRGETKYEIACILTGIFRELLWRLPPARTFYKGEHPAMSIFDAIAQGFTYWTLHETQIPPPE